MPKKKLIIVIIAAIVVIAVGAVYFFMPKAEKEPEAEKVPVPENNSEIIRPVYSLDTFIVNLADKGGRRFLRITMVLELNDESFVEEMDKRLSQIKDSILMILPTKRFEDISNVEGKIALRDEIMTKLNSLLKNEIITNIYFVEFVIQ
ncbi:MAG: flagellar basal body-associated FliL family protein [Desulfobacterales bacterium]|nr:flagellar basal body-associated FliL family protein [Desulfobacterales bacterium]